MLITKMWSSLCSIVSYKQVVGFKILQGMVPESTYQESWGSRGVCGENTEG